MTKNNCGNTIVNLKEKSNTDISIARSILVTTLLFLVSVNGIIMLPVVKTLEPKCNIDKTFDKLDLLFWYFTSLLLIIILYVGSAFNVIILIFRELFVDYFDCDDNIMFKNLNPLFWSWKTIVILLIMWYMCAFAIIMLIDNAFELGIFE
jgi:hypothetical protein